MAFGQLRLSSQQAARYTGQTALDSSMLRARLSCARLRRTRWRGFDLREDAGHREVHRAAPQAQSTDRRSDKISF